MTYTYDHMDEFEGVKFPDFKQYSGNLILYGAGINGALCAFALKELGVDFLCFCDSDPSKQGTQYIGAPVYSPTECSRRFPHAAVLFDAYCSGKDVGKLSELGYNTILFPASLFLQLDCDKAAEFISEQLGTGGDGYSFRETVDAFQVFEWIDEYMIRGVGYVTGRESIPRAINLDVTDRCTLRCKNCLALKPFFHSPRHTPWHELNRAIRNLLKMHWFRRFHILGGEPFLYPELDKLLCQLTASSEIEHVNIITNGTVVPNQKVLEALQSPKIMVRISYYGNHSSRYKELEQICKQNKINVRVHAQRWVDIGRPLNVVSRDEETQVRFDLCCQNKGSFFYVLHGKVTLCPFAANTNALELFHAADTDYVDLLADYAPKEMLKQLNILYDNQHALTACKYCNGWLPYNTNPIPVAEQYQSKEFPQLPKYEQ